MEKRKSGRGEGGEGWGGGGRGTERNKKESSFKILISAIHFAKSQLVS